MSVNVYDGLTHVLDFSTQVDALIGQLKTNGFNENDYIGFDFCTNIEFLKAYDACVKAGFSPVILADDDVFSQSKHLCLSGYIKEKQPGVLDVVHFNSACQAKAPKSIVVVTKTSGTTGVPKCIAWHRNGIHYQTETTSKLFGYQDQCPVCVTIPLWSSYGLSLVHMWQQGLISLVLFRKIHPRHVIDACIYHHAKGFEGVPRIYSALLNQLLRQPKCADGLSKVDIFGCGGDFLHLPLARRWHEQIGVQLLDGYGLSEMGPNVAVSTPEHYKLGYVGKPLPGTEITFTSDQEILVQSPSIMHLVWDFKQDEMVPQSWLNTGDLGFMDGDGFLKIIGRKKNSIIVNRYNINPEQVEMLINQHDEVDSVAVTTVIIHEKTKMVAFFVPKANSAIDAKMLMAWCQMHMKPIFIPHFFVPIERIPTNANGKIDRIQLNELAGWRFQNQRAVATIKSKIIN